MTFTDLHEAKVEVTSQCLTYIPLHNLCISKHFGFKIFKVHSFLSYDFKRTKLGEYAIHSNMYLFAATLLATLAFRLRFGVALFELLKNIFCSRIIQTYFLFEFFTPFI